MAQGPHDLHLGRAAAGSVPGQHSGSNGWSGTRCPPDPGQELWPPLLIGLPGVWSCCPPGARGADRALEGALVLLRLSLTNGTWQPWPTMPGMSGHLVLPVLR